ncbi:MAG TPA: enoyl-CoA hydratase-related protein [Acidimicrobiales bacterium]|nr:enoyl-CoA hydratase-related protein [Acidimicrobiales bacterium]
MTGQGTGPVGEDQSYRPVDGLRVALDGAVLRLTLDRPAKRNALDDTMVAGLVGALDAAGRDEAVRAVVLAGAGDHFCGGADIVARNAGGREAPRPRVGSIQRRVPTLAHRLVPLVLSVQVPVVCRVQGWAAGIGFHLALAADFTVAADDARFWEPFSERGFTPDSAGTWLLPRLAGMVRARDLLLLGRELGAAEAVDWGLIHAAVPAADLDAEVAALADRLAAGPTVALGLTKWLLGSGQSATLEAHLRDEAMALELSSRSDDFREGLAAFRERRPPGFTGR